MPGARNLLLATVLVAAGCSSQTALPELSLTSITPDRADFGTTPAATVRGEGFHVALTSDLDDGTPDNAGIEVTVGGSALTNISLMSETEVAGQLPPGLAIGTHDLVVTMSDGRSATLPAALEIITSCQDDADNDGAIAASCGGDDCDDDDDTEKPGVTWYPDGDGDGDGDVTSAGNDCERAAASDVDNNFDCDDGDMDVFNGSPCTDGDDCTVEDTCSAGVCSGVDTCNCSNDCNDCSAAGCCTEACTGSCPTCGSDCSCDQTCDGGSQCNASCSADSRCRFTASNTGDASLSCASRSVCNLTCTDVADSCSMSCASDAQCLIECGGNASCDISCSGGSTMSCPGDIIVCHRECP